MSPHPLLRGVRARSRAHATALRLAAVAASVIVVGGGLAAPAQAWTGSALASVARVSTALPVMGVPYRELLQVAPQLAGSPAAASGAFGHGAVLAAAPAGAGSIAVVRPGANVDVRRSPGGSVVEQLDSTTDTSTHERAFTVYAVTGGRWLGVSVPALGGHLGWIAANPTQLLVRPAVQAIRVSLSARRLWLLDDGRVVLSTLVVIGGASTPTPPGQFSVDDIVHFTPASPEYGVGALALSVPPPGRNWVYWRVAIHGENNLGSLGGTGSLGCVHVPTPDLQRLMQVPVGTPVDIVT